MASVNWISPPAPRGVFSNKSNIAGVNTYRPTTDKFDGHRLIGTDEKLYLYRRHNNNQTAILTQTATRFDEEISLYSDIANRAKHQSYTKTYMVAKQKLIIKLHLLFLITKAILTIDFRRAIFLLKKLTLCFNRA